MGQWLEVLRNRPANGPATFLTDYKDDIIAEIAPHPLLYAGNSLPSDFHQYFPKLCGLMSSGEYERESEKWLLSPDQISVIDQEFSEVRRLCRGETDPYPYSRFLDVGNFMERWRGGSDPAEFEDWLCRIEGVLQRAIAEKAWIMLSF